MKTDLNYKQCRALADKWLLLNPSAPEWNALIRARFEQNQFVRPGIDEGRRTFKELRALFLNGQTPSKVWCDEINKLNYMLLTQRLTGK